MVRVRRERFLTEMDAVIPWGSLFALIAPHYAKPGRGALPPAAGDHAPGVLPAAVVRPLRSQGKSGAVDGIGCRAKEGTENKNVPHSLSGSVV